MPRRQIYGGDVMSAKAMGWALEQVTELPVDKLVLIAVANFCDENHQCYPSRKKLAELAMCSVDTVDRALRRLELGGLIEKAGRKATHGRQTSNLYSLPLGDYGKPTPKMECGEGRKLRPQNAEKGGPQIAAGRAARAAAGGAAPVRPEPTSITTKLKKVGELKISTGSEVKAVDSELLRRAEGLGLNAKAIEGDCFGPSVKDPSAYFQSLVRKRLREMVPGLSDDAIGRGLCGDRKAYGDLMNLIMMAGTP